MTPRSAATIMRTADPAAKAAVDDAWADAEGRAAYERIIADDQPAEAGRPNRRRRVLIGAGLAAAAGAAAAVVGVPGLNHNGAAPAWSVTKHADGTVSVKISDYRDPAGLQHRLRAAGLRANVVTLPGQCGTVTGGPEHVKYALLLVNLQGFQAPDSWRQLISVNGDPAYGPGLDIDGVAGVGEFLSGSETSLALTMRPSLLAAQDTVTVGFPADHRGRAINIEVAATGSEPTCVQGVDSTRR